SGIVARAPVDSVHRIGSADGIGAQKGADREQPRPGVEGGVLSRGAASGRTNTLDGLSDDVSVIAKELLWFAGVVVDAGVEFHQARALTAHHQEHIVIRIYRRAMLHLLQFLEGRSNQAVHPLGLSSEISLFEVRRI